MTEITGMTGIKRWLFVLALLGACKKDTSVGKIGELDVENMTVADSKGKCLDDTLTDGREGTHCFAMKPLGIGGMTVAVAGYFGGREPGSKLVELQLSADACDEEAFLTWMRTNFGAPFESHDTRHAWKNDHMIILGSLPRKDDPTSCLIRFMPAREQALFDYYWAKVKAQ